MNNSIAVTGNAAQIKAIHHAQGPAIVLAGPGSGKTFVIVNRIRELIDSGAADPSEILVITFTKASALEMQDRFRKLTDSRYSEVHFGTFHSVFYQIIRLSLPGNPPNLITESEKTIIMDHILKDMKSTVCLQSGNTDFDYDQETEKQLLSYISRIKNEGLHCEKDQVPEAFETEAIPLKEYFGRIFKEYNSMLKELGKIDFDDMLLICQDLIENNIKIRQKWQKCFRFILIDEYQDINTVQFKIIQKLAEPENNLFVVGDDDQSIYGFRGSKPEFMINFCRFYQNAIEIPLEINYRCDRNILSAAELVIAENKVRFDKKISAAKTSGQGIIKGLLFSDQKSQWKAISEYIREKSTSPGSMAVIFRTNQEASSLAEMLTVIGVKFNILQAPKSFFSENEIDTILAYIRFASCSHERKYFYKIMNKPVRYIKRESAASENVCQQKVLDYYSGRPEMVRTVKVFFHDCEIISHLRPFIAINYIRKEIGFDKYILKSYSSERAGQIITMLDELGERSRSYTDNRTFLRFIDEYEEKFNTNSKKIRTADRADGVTLITMHAAKGLEFDTVWLPNLNEGVIPNRKSIMPDQIEEERRMLYVGMTRAKSTLILSYLTGTQYNTMLPSRFLRPLDAIWTDKKEAQLK